MACAEDNLQVNLHLQCSVCFLPYNTSNHKPKMMPCGHSFCLECLGKIAGSQDSISCPQDRTKYPIPDGSVDNFPNNFTILNLLADLCADCGVRPKQKLCLEEHCSKYLCDGCRENHRQSFHSDLRAALTELKQEASLNNDDDDIEQLEANTEHAVAEVTKLCEELKHNLIDAIKDSKEKSIESLLEWKEVLATTKAKCRTQTTKLLSSTSATYQAEIPDDVITDTYKQMTEIKTKLAMKQHQKQEDAQFHYKNLKKEFDVFSLNLHRIIMPSAERATESQASKDITTCPISESSTTMQIVSKPDYTSVTLQSTYGKSGSGFDEFYGPTGICVSPVTNQVAVVDCYNHRIHLLTDSLRPVFVFGEGGNGNIHYKFPRDVIITDRGVMFITDQYNHRIQSTDSSGAFLFTFGSEGSGNDQFQCPSGIASTHNHLYICDSDNYRVKMTTHEGTYVREFGTKGEESGQFLTSLRYIAVSEIHNKAVISDDDGNIHIFTLTGQFIRMIEAKQPPLSIHATGLAFDTHGNLIVADMHGKQLVVLGEEDQLLATIGSGQLSDPRGVAVTLSGDIIVCDWDKDYVKLFKVPHVTKQ